MCTPLQGRCIHTPLTSTPNTFPNRTQHTHRLWRDAHVSLDRSALVRALFQRIRRYPNVKVHFHHEVNNISRALPLSSPHSSSPSLSSPSYLSLPSTCVLSTLSLSSQVVTESHVDMILGCDGVGSAVRRLIQLNEPTFSTVTSCDTHEYKSFFLYGPPLQSSHPHISSPHSDRTGHHFDARDCMSFIHTWPRGDVLLHAMPALPHLSLSPSSSSLSPSSPSLPQSPSLSKESHYFHCTFILPKRSSASPSFSDLKSEKDLTDFFLRYFPDIRDPDYIASQLIRFPPNPLRVVKCNRLHSLSLPVALLGLPSLLSFLTLSLLSFSSSYTLTFLSPLFFSLPRPLPQVMLGIQSSLTSDKGWYLR